MWIKCHKKKLDWSRLSTKRQACDYLTGGNTQTQTWGMSSIGHFAFMWWSHRGHRSRPDPVSWGGLKFPQRKWAGNGSRRGKLEARKAAGRNVVFFWGLWRLGPELSVGWTHLRSLPKGEDKRLLPESPSLGTRQQGTSTALRQPVLCLWTLRAFRTHSHLTICRFYHSFLLSLNF